MEYMWLEKLTLAGLVLSLLNSCIGPDKHTITVINHLNQPRVDEMLEIPVEQLEELLSGINQSFVVVDTEGDQVPYQLTHDGLLIFPVSVAAQGSVDYIIKRGTPLNWDTIACGNCYPERLDDIAWENDRSAYRLYGPALQRSGERAFGYDVWTKNVSYPIVAVRYHTELNPETKEQIKELRQCGKLQKANSLAKSVSYHVDHGTGMDCYSVGPTLGCGTSALLVDSCIIYPYCYKDYQILDNGPLRFTVQLEYNPLVIEKDSSVLETRRITLDKGSNLNKTTVIYHNLLKPYQLVTGLVIHSQNPDGALFDSRLGIIAYADSTDNAHNNNGVIHVGALFAKSPTWCGVRWFGEQEIKAKPGALGHVMAFSSYRPQDEFVYYWGASWSKGGFQTQEEWFEYLKDYQQKLSSPLEVHIN